jgi:hypothetical protein
MTASTGKRSFRACLRCRRRKTKCDLDVLGGRKEPPCRTCHLSGNDCVLVQSKRGRRRDKDTPTTLDNAIDIPEPLVHENDSSATSVGLHSTCSNAESSIPHAENSLSIFESGKEAEVALKNPSDALAILARADERSSVASNHSLAHDTASSGTSIRATENTSTTLEGFELLTSGALQMSLILELLQTSVTPDNLAHYTAPLILS